MPVEDINAEKLATEMLNVIKSSETTTEFWKNNAPILSTLLFILLFGGIFLALIILLRYGLKKALKR